MSLALTWSVIDGVNNTLIPQEISVCCPNDSGRTGVEVARILYIVRIVRGSSVEEALDIGDHRV